MYDLALMLSDGSSRCGLYAAASFAIDKLKCDNELDVFLSCRYIIKARPQAITSLVIWVSSFKLGAPRPCQNNVFNKQSVANCDTNSCSADDARELSSAMLSNDEL